MSIKIWNMWFKILLIILVICTTFLDAADDDPILTFYCQRARDTFNSRNPINSGLDYSFRAKTNYYKYRDKGTIVAIDSFETEYFFSYGELDSSLVIQEPSHNKQAVTDFSYTNIFNDKYDFYFFPNDTGGVELSIGFDIFPSDNNSPTGIAIIDRDRYFLRRLHLFYPNNKRYKQISRSFHFVEYENYNFPDTIIEIKGELGVFATEFYRIETSVSGIKIYR